MTMRVFIIDDDEDHAESIANWRSVIVWGTYEELSGQEAERVVAMFLDHFLPALTGARGATSHGADAVTLRQAEAAAQLGVVFRLSIEEKTGRYEQSGNGWY